MIRISPIRCCGFPLRLVHRMQPLILARRHRFGHLADHLDAVAILEGPHAVRIEKSDSVVIVQDMLQIGLEARHCAYFAVDERKAARLSGHVQVRQQIANGAAFGQMYLRIRETWLSCIPSVTRQFTIQPRINRDVRQFILLQSAGKCRPRRPGLAANPLRARAH